jgi:hypothetical protein
MGSEWILKRFKVLTAASMKMIAFRPDDGGSTHR